MAERWMRISHVTVRVIATFALADLAIGAFADKYYPALAHTLANTRQGQIPLFLTMAACLLLPFCVGVEGWWMRKRKAERKALWIDAALAIACFLSLMAVVLYAFGHYAMI